MSSPIQPTFAIRETSRNIKDFMANNQDAFWRILKPLLPWIILLHFVDIVMTLLYFSDSQNGFIGGSLIASYFYSCLVISWHRVVIFGADRTEIMNPFKPKKHELVFVGVGLLLMVLAFVAGVLSALSFLVLKNMILTAIVIGVVILCAMYLGYRICFYFPAKATDNSISLGEAFRLTKGYFWKVMTVPFLAALKPILIMFLYLLGAGIIAGVIVTLLGNDQVVSSIFQFVVFLPVIGYFYPVLYTIFVVSVSNYYLHALQNKKV